MTLTVEEARCTEAKVLNAAESKPGLHKITVNNFTDSQGLIYFLFVFFYYYFFFIAVWLVTG